ncbi:HWE histidine kinase domain-containing protein [Mesorhizobium sp. CAU 1732]|uniref:HWE histidine kinase domain-containing protein n=1 Tax=Mesorhizobium sp. CAU 1732 TaxID=3140358 RepID=UPI003260EFF8
MPSRRIADLVLESAIDYAIITMDLEGLITSWSKGAEAIFGWAEDEMIGRHAEIFFTPEDRQNGIIDREMRDALQKGRGNDERWHLRKDDTRFWASGEMLPLHDGGPTEGFLKIVRDRTEQKKARELQAMLNQELSHRLKNQLGMVQAIVNQSLRRADDIEQARKAIGDRLGVLGRAHELLLTGYGERAAVRTVIEKSVNLREDGHASQFSLSGPNLEVGPRAALSLALILHELTTNAFKYGSLSLPEGLVEIRWTIADLGGEPVFQLAWQEQNGPRVTIPTSMGFGSRLINNGISGATNSVETEYNPEGVRCTIRVSLSDFQSEN